MTPEYISCFALLGTFVPYRLAIELEPQEHDKMNEEGHELLGSYSQQNVSNSPEPPHARERAAPLSVYTDNTIETRLQKSKCGGARGFLSRAWSYISQLLEDEPYQVRERWRNTTWHLLKRLITAAVLSSGEFALGICYIN